MIDIKNIRFSYKKSKDVFDNFSLQLDSPGIYGLLGENGIGKTTLLKMISTLYFPSYGKILIDGKDSRQREVETLAKLYFMPDTIDSYWMKFQDFVENHAVFYDNFSPEILDDCFNCFHVDRQQTIKSMSLGERKKAFCSFALAAGTEILLMDEPTNGMDVPSKKIFRQLLMRHIREDQYVLISTHLINDVEKLLDHYIILNHDNRPFNASAQEIMEKYAFVTQLTQEEALYAEPCVNGYKAIVPNQGEPTDIDLEMLFNAVNSGGLK